MDERRNALIKNFAEDANLISIDTRTIKKGDVFVAIKGKNFDGHDFVKDAFRKGAKAAMVSEAPKGVPEYDKRLIKVKDTIKTLGETASLHREGFKIPVIAVTGSNGKTTVKDMIAHLLRARYNVLKNETSKNNFIGLPLTLCKLEKKHDLAVLEMGMNHLGEIRRLSRIAKPDMAAIINIGPSHLEFLKTLKNIFKAKSELLKELKPGTVSILNKDDAFLRKVKTKNFKKIYFGIEKRCDFQAKNIMYNGKKWFFSLKGKETFELPLFGRHNIYNALAAIAVARQFKISFSDIAKRLGTFKQSCPMRLEFKNIRGVKILDDSYNSNPSSLECAVNTLLEYDTEGKRIVVSGDMLELGKEAKAMHELLGERIAKSRVDCLITMGNLSVFMNKKATKFGMKNIYHAKTHRDIAAFLRQTAKPGDVVLIKGSRGMTMEKVIEEFA